MRAFCRKLHQARKMSANEVMQIYGNALFYKSIASNSFYAIVCNNGPQFNNITEIIFRTSEKTPLWKQQMNISIGKPIIQDKSVKIIHSQVPDTNLLS